jgi:hypothetical protein
MREIFASPAKYKSLYEASIAVRVIDVSHVSISKNVCFEIIIELTKFRSHCGWSFNCIGVKNHRYFMIFTLSLSLVVWFFGYLASICELSIFTVII